eukprot:SAG11_NODE_26742_length_341_cov_0.871901_1_plen_26_part_01
MYQMAMKNTRGTVTHVHYATACTYAG